MLMQPVEPPFARPPRGSSRPSGTARRRLRPSVLSMAARAVTALIGGYAASAGVATLSARLLPIARVEATIWGMILSFLLFALLGLWAFHEPRLARVAGVIWGVAGVSITAAWMLGARP